MAPPSPSRRSASSPSRAPRNSVEPSPADGVSACRQLSCNRVCSPWAATVISPARASDRGERSRCRNIPQPAPASRPPSAADDHCARNLFPQGISGACEPGPPTTAAGSYSGPRAPPYPLSERELGGAMQLHWGVSARRAFAVNVIAYVVFFAVAFGIALCAALDVWLFRNLIFVY